MDKIIKVTVSHIRVEILSCPKFFGKVRITMQKTPQEQVDAKNANLDLIPNPAELKDFFNEHKAALKSRANTNTINMRIGPMNVLIGRVNKIYIAHKTHIDRVRC